MKVDENLVAQAVQSILEQKGMGGMPGRNAGSGGSSMPGNTAAGRSNVPGGAAAMGGNAMPGGAASMGRNAMPGSMATTGGNAMPGGAAGADGSGAENFRMSVNITLNLAELLMKRVEAKAQEMGMRVVTAVSDAHGNPVAVRCMDDAFIGSYDVALNKTYTAVSFKMSTEELGRLSQPGGPLYGIQFTNQGRIVIFGGGVPLRVKGEIIGAFGVSGGTAEQDTCLAHYAEETFRDMTSRISRK